MADLLEFLRTHEEAFRSRSRLSSLYSDFRSQRQTNPDGYQANATAWLRALSAATRAGLIPSQTAAGQNDHFSLQTGGELARALQTKEFGRPLALGAVVDDAVKKGDLIPLREFLDRKESVYAGKSRIPSLGQVVGWGLRQLGVIGSGDDGEDKLVKGDFVLLDNVENAATTVLERAAKVANGNTARVFTKKLFESTFAPALDMPALTSRDMSVLLVHLAREKQAISYAPATGTIKFKAPGDAHPSPIEQEDETIASLRTLITTIEPQIDDLTNRISKLEVTARDAVASKNVTAAKSALRSKKLADATLQKRTATLTQLEEVYAKIEQAADQVEMVRVMEASSQTLRSLNAKTGGVEHVQDVVDGLQEQMGNADEIQNAISDVSAGAVDEGEVDDELEEMERVEREKVEAATKAEREKTESAEKAETEKKEAEEAEKIRQRLAELEPPKESTSQEKKEGNAGQAVQS